MTKDKYIEKITKYMADNDLEREDGLTYLDGIQDAAALARQLDESRKVVIPQFVADWIEEAKEHYGSEIDPLKIVYWTGDYISDTDSHYEWLENIYNQKLLLNAIANGYEVED